MWIYLPSELSLSAADMKASALDSSWPSEMLPELSVMWRSKPMLRRFWRRVPKAARWMMHLSGIILKPSMAARGVAKWISSLGATPASRSALRVNGRVKKIPVIYGRIFGASSKKSSPKAASLKMSQGTLVSGMKLSGENYRTWAIQLKKASLARRKLAHPMSANAFISSPWPTPLKGDADKHMGKFYGKNQTLTGAAKQWPTPRAEHDSGRHRGQADTLHSAVKQWPTPNVGDVMGSWTPSQKKLASGTKIQIGLANAAKSWPTPTTRDYRAPDLPSSGNFKRKLSKGFTIDLNSAAAQWPTPSARDFRSGKNSAATRGRNSRPLSEQAYHFSRLLKTLGRTGKKFSGAGRRLNPRFVEWLMGLPQGWTSFAPLEMGSFQEWQRLHS